MRSVRCEACGTRALIAASQCPKCGHLFALRDGFGELPPLAHCSQCDAYYPASAGSCKWCGTLPEPPRAAAIIWKRIRWTRVGWSRVGFGALIAMAWVGWLLREPTPKPGSHRRAVAPTPAVVNADTVAVATSSLPVVMPQAAPASAAATPLATPPTTPLATPLAKAAPVPAPRSVAHGGKSSAHWVSSIARDWVIVRSDASDGARIVCSLGPASRVQLGEARDGWRRIRSHGVAGWVDESRSSFAEARRATRSGGRGRGLASR